MSAHKNLDRICVVIVAISLILTVLFMNGESLGITKIVDEDAEQNSDSVYFTSNDLNGNWDTSGAVTITLDGDDAEISGNGAYVIDGSVVITNAGYYVISGTLSDGYISVDAYDSSKVWILLNGVEINCSDNACIRVDQADKVFLTLAEGSQNTLTSGSEYSEEALNDGTDGAIYAHDDLTINGSGSLTVNSQYEHGISANDDLVITGGTITVTAPSDAIRANDSIRICSAEITATGGDEGIVTTNEVENGYMYVESGTLKITAADDGIHTTGDIEIAGGDITVSAGDDGIHSDTSVLVTDGTLLIEECSEGIEALTIDVSGGDITVYAEDDGFNANGGSGNAFGGGHAFGGGDAFGSEGDTSGSSGDGGHMGGGPGGHADDGDDHGGHMGGGPGGGHGGHRGEESSDTNSATESTDGEMPAPPDAEEGMPAAPDTDSSGDSAQTTSETADEETFISISGGTITIIIENGRDADGLDSNGDIRISGGTIYISLPGSSGNCAVDYASENGGVAEISGGTLIACGDSSMAEGFDSSSTQASVLYNISTAAEAGSKLAVEDSEGNVLMSWDVPCSFTSALISCPELQVGSTYKVVIGDSEEEITLEEISTSYGDVQGGMFGGNMGHGDRNE